MLKSFAWPWLCLPDMGTLEITKGRQALELRSNLSERRALTDPIKPSEGPEEFSVRNLQWAKAHGEHHGPIIPADRAVVRGRQ